MAFVIGWQSFLFDFYSIFFHLVLIICPASLPPSHAIGMYATNRSKIVNHIGDGTIKTIVMPPIRKNIPIIMANRNLLFAAINPAIRAPTKVPNA